MIKNLKEDIAKEQGYRNWQNIVFDGLEEEMLDIVFERLIQKISALEQERDALLKEKDLMNRELDLVHQCLTELYEVDEAYKIVQKYLRKIDKLKALQPTENDKTDNQ